MLRFLLLGLLVANLLFFAFTRGWFDGIGLRSLGDREPARLAAQVRPDAIRLLPMGAGASAAADAACYEAGPFAATEAVGAEAALRAVLPAGTWTDDRTESAGAVGTVVSHMFRVPNADPALAARLASIRLDPTGRSFAPCNRPARAPR